MKSSLRIIGRICENYGAEDVIEVNRSRDVYLKSTERRANQKLKPLTTEQIDELVKV